VDALFPSNLPLDHTYVYQIKKEQTGWAEGQGMPPLHTL